MRKEIIFSVRFLLYSSRMHILENICSTSVLPPTISTQKTTTLRLLMFSCNVLSSLCKPIDLTLHEILYLGIALTKRCFVENAIFKRRRSSASRALQKPAIYKRLFSSIDDTVCKAFVRKLWNDKFSLTASIVLLKTGASDVSVTGCETEAWTPIPRELRIQYLSSCIVKAVWKYKLL